MKKLFVFICLICVFSEVDAKELVVHGDRSVRYTEMHVTDPFAIRDIEASESVDYLYRFEIPDTLDFIYINMQYEYKDNSGTGSGSTLIPLGDKSEYYLENDKLLIEGDAQSQIMLRANQFVSDFDEKLMEGIALTESEKEEIGEHILSLVKDSLENTYILPMAYIIPHMKLEELYGDLLDILKIKANDRIKSLKYYQDLITNLNFKKEDIIPTLLVSTEPKLELGENYVLVFWATWCGPCINEMDEVKELSLEYPEYEFINISIDREREKWENHPYELKHNYRLTDSSLLGKAGIITIPHHIISKKGVLEYDLELAEIRKRLEGE